MFPDRERIRLLGKLIESYINEALLAMSDITSSQPDDVSKVIILGTFIYRREIMLFLIASNLEHTNNITCAFYFIIVIHVLSGRRWISG